MKKIYRLTDRHSWGNQRIAAVFAACLAGVIAVGSAHAADVTYVGVGLSIAQGKRDQILVTDVRKNAPAERAGITPGEAVLAVDGQSTLKLSPRKVGDLIRGQEIEGTAVTLSLLKQDAESARDVTLTRERIVIECFIEGRVSLWLSGSSDFGTIDGWVNSREAIRMQVSRGSVSGSFKGEPFFLELRELGGGSQVLSGRIHGAYVNWSGYNGSWNTTQACIEK